MKKSASYSVEPCDQEMLRIMDFLDMSEDGTREREERQQLGRYRLIEAAEAIVRQNAHAPFRKHEVLDAQRAADRTGEGYYDEMYDFEERANNEIRALMASVRSGDLPVYLPGRTERHRTVDHVGRYHEEVYWDDLNVWLAANEPRTARVFAFPDPEQSPKSAESEPSKKCSDSADWRQRVRDEATKICLARQAEGKSPRPSKVSLSEDLEIWCRNYEVFTARGIHPSAGSIKKQVLNMWRYPV